MTRGAPLRPTRWLEHLERHAAVALRGEDPEGVHQVRVAARRLRVWLELGGHEVLVGDVRWLARELGRLRDLDVIRHGWRVRPGSPVEAWLARLESTSRDDAARTLHSPRYRGLVKGLRSLAPLDVGRAQKRLGAFSRTATKRASALATGRPVEPDDLADAVLQVHALRRSVRRLRYAREWLGERAGPLKALQEALGALCDVAALARLLEQYALDTGDEVTALRIALSSGLLRMVNLLVPALRAAQLE